MPAEKLSDVLTDIARTPKFRRDLDLMPSDFLSLQRIDKRVRSVNHNTKENRQ